MQNALLWSGEKAFGTSASMKLLCRKKDSAIPHGLHYHDHDTNNLNNLSMKRHLSKQYFFSVAADSIRNVNPARATVFVTFFSNYLVERECGVIFQDNF